MFGIGFGEMMVIGLLILLAVGPDKLPTMIKTVAKTYRQFRRAAMDIRSSTGIDDFLRDEELRELAELRKEKLLAMAAQKPKPAAPVDKPPAPDASSSPVDPAPEEAIPVAAAPWKVPPTEKGVVGGLTYKQRVAERPPEGVDIAEVRFAEKPSDDEIVRAKLAAAELAPTKKMASG